MTNNSDEFENNDQEEMQHEEGDRGTSTGLVGNLTQAWRSKPLFKLLVLMIVVGAIVAASFTLFSGNQSVTTSQLASPPLLNVAPGGPVSPYMKQQTDLANDQRSKEALAMGSSALPTPIGQSIDISEFSEKAAKNDELNELKAQVENLRREQTMQLSQQKSQPVQQQVQVQPVVPQPQNFDTALSSAMQRQMGQLVESWAPSHLQEIVVAKPDDKSALSDSASTVSNRAQLNAVAVNSPPVNTGATPRPKAFIPSGTVNYAQLLTEANSDVPGTILAEIVSGPLAGARAIGEFKVINNYSDYLTLQFRLANLKGKEYPINAIALDPDTTLGGMATEVDERYFTRVVLPAGGAFLQGLGSALGQNSSNTTTNGSFAIVQQSKAGLEQGVFQGLSQGANTAGQFFQNQANQTKPLVRVAAGTPFGIFFITSVYDPDALQTMNSQYPNQYPNNYGQARFGGPNYGQLGFGELGNVNGSGIPLGNNGYPMGANGYPMNGYPNGNNGYGNGSAYGNMPSYGTNGLQGNNAGLYGASNQASNNSNLSYPNIGASTNTGNNGSSVSYVSGSGLSNPNVGH